MPTYTYQCKSCKYEFDHLQRIADPLLTKCPSCGEETLIRLIGGGAGLVFKGSGFYKTDYTKSNSTGSTSSSSKSSTKESKTDTKESKAETKTETKPESKSDSSPTKKESSAGKSSDSK